MGDVDALEGELSGVEAPDSTYEVPAVLERVGCIVRGDWNELKRMEASGVNGVREMRVLKAEIEQE